MLAFLLAAGGQSLARGGVRKSCVYAGDVSFPRVRSVFGMSCWRDQRTEWGRHCIALGGTTK